MTVCECFSCVACGGLSDFFAGSGSFCTVPPPALLKGKRSLLSFFTPYHSPSLPPSLPQLSTMLKRVDACRHDRTSLASECSTLLEDQRQAPIIFTKSTILSVHRTLSSERVRAVHFLNGHGAHKASWPRPIKRTVFFSVDGIRCQQQTPVWHGREWVGCAYSRLYFYR